MREAEAIVALMRHDGIRAIVPLWRNDAGNNGLHDSVQIRFQALGGTVAQGFRYEPATSDFSTATASVASQIENLISRGRDPSTIAVYLAAFDEVVGVFHSAQGNATLSDTAWYGSDGVALSAVLPADLAAAAFAVNADYPNPIFGLDDTLQNEWQPIADAIQARTGSFQMRPDIVNPKAFLNVRVRPALARSGGRGGRVLHRREDEPGRHTRPRLVAHLPMGLSLPACHGNFARDWTPACLRGRASRRPRRRTSGRDHDSGMDMVRSIPCRYPGLRLGSPAGGYRPPWRPARTGTVAVLRSTSRSTCPLAASTIRTSATDSRHCCANTISVPST